VIDMFGFNVPLFSDPIDEFLFDTVLDPILPGRGLPIPLPVRIGLYSIELQRSTGVAQMNLDTFDLRLIQRALEAYIGEMDS